MDEFIIWRNEKIEEIENITGWKFDNSVQFDKNSIFLNFINGNQLVVLQYENRMFKDRETELID